MSNQAWVTLATNDSYALGALVLAHSLKKVSSVNGAVVLITPSVTESMRGRLSAVFSEVVMVDVLDSRDAAHLALLARPELGITFTKIHCWNLTQYDKCVFLDADTLVVQNCDELFEREELSAAPDVGWPDCFNSGVFVYSPSADTFEKLLEFAKERGSFDGGDQGLLNSFFSTWAHGDISKHLPFIYNVTSVAFYSYLPALKQYGQDLKIVHFIGNNKPWLANFNWESRTVSAPTHLQPTLQLWWDIFASSVHPQLDMAMAGLAGTMARLTLGAPASQQSALDEHTRRQGWEAGNIDYMGADSFANIWAKISATLAQAPSPPATDSSTPPATESSTPAAMESSTPLATESSTPPATESSIPPATESSTPPATQDVKAEESGSLVPVLSETVPKIEPIETTEPQSIAAEVELTSEPVTDKLTEPVAPPTEAIAPPIEDPVEVVKVAEPEAISVEATPIESVVVPTPISEVPKSEEQGTNSQATEPVEASPVDEPLASEASALVADVAPSAEAPKSSTDSPPLISTPVKDAEAPKSAEEGKCDTAIEEPSPRTESRNAPPTDKLNCQLKPSVQSTLLLTPDSELEDAATLAQSIIASELGIPSTPQVTSATPPVLPAAPFLKDSKQLSVEEPELPTPPVSLAQIGILPSTPQIPTDITQSPAVDESIEHDLKSCEEKPAPNVEPKLDEVEPEPEVSTTALDTLDISLPTQEAKVPSSEISTPTTVIPVAAPTPETKTVKSTPEAKISVPESEPIEIPKAISRPATGIKDASIAAVQTTKAEGKMEPKPEVKTTPTLKEIVSQENIIQSADQSVQPSVSDIRSKTEEETIEPKPNVVTEPRKKKVVKKIVKKESTEGSEKGTGTSEPASPATPVPPPRKKEKKPVEKK